jgi:hypothetical protein
MKTIIIRFPCKPTKYRNTMKRRIEKHLESMGLAIGLATAINGRGSYYDAGIRKTFFLETSKAQITYELDFDDTWTDEHIETAMRFLERIEKVSSVICTDRPPSATIRA